MEQAMELSAETLEAIGRYVRGNLGAWMREVDLDRDIELRERTVRVEEELHSFPTLRSSDNRKSVV